MKFLKTYLFIQIISVILLGCGSDDTEVEPVKSVHSLIYPANNESNLTPSIQFLWESSENAVSYELRIGLNNVANDIIISDLTTTSHIVDEIRYGKQYYWKVLAFDNEGNAISSQTFKFSTRKNYEVIDNNFYMPQLDRSRRISIYLPPNYDSESSRYPVVYMHDGQALFNTNDYPGEEWEIDETLDLLYQQNGFSLIVVGIDYNTEGLSRVTEYSPWVNKGEIEEWADWSTGLGGEGDAYIQFIMQTLKPYIDENYRTLSDKENTGIIGSSMGGLISCYAGLEYPDVFGKVGVFSPSFWFSEGGAFELATAKASGLGNNKFYFLAGSSEVSLVNIPQDMEIMIESLEQSGFDSNNMTKKIVPNGRHVDALWRGGFRETIRWLFIK